MGLSLALLSRWLWLVWCLQGVCCLFSLSLSVSLSNAAAAAALSSLSALSGPSSALCTGWMSLGCDAEMSNPRGILPVLHMVSNGFSPYGLLA